MLNNNLKVAIVGEQRVGKTSLCNVMMKKLIDRNYIKTIGADLFVKYFIADNKSVRISLWDLGGDQRFFYILLSYIKNSQIIIFSYSAESFNSFKEMVRRYEKYLEENILKDKHIIFIVTKIDSKKSIPGYFNWGLEYASKYKHPFIKTSSYTKEGVEKLLKECFKYQDNLNQKNNSCTKLINYNNLCEKCCIL